MQGERYGKLWKLLFKYENEYKPENEKYIEILALRIVETSKIVAILEKQPTENATSQLFT
jgi:hypothetical protein